MTTKIDAKYQPVKMYKQTRLENNHFRKKGSKMSMSQKIIAFFHNNYHNNY